MLEMEVSAMADIVLPCRGCGVAVFAPADDAVGEFARQYGVYCPDCQKEQTKVTAEALRPALPPYSSFCPPCFEDTKITELPCPVKSTAALSWCFGPLGLNLWGWPGTGKTRTMSLLVQALLEMGKSVIAFGPEDFRAQCQAHNYRRSPWLRKLSRVDVLFIDDLDKMNLTREMEKDFFSVLSNRMGRKPVLMTGNSTGEQIEYSFKLGYAMVRRIRDHCLSIHFGKVDITNKANTLPL